jgi:hypothetical protein
MLFRLTYQHLCARAFVNISFILSCNRFSTWWPHWQMHLKKYAPTLPNLNRGRRKSQLSINLVNYVHMLESSWNPHPNILEPGRLQRDRPATCVIAQQHSSAIVVSLRFDSHKQTFGSAETRSKLCKSETSVWQWVYSLVIPSLCLLDNRGIHCQEQRCKQATEWLNQGCLMFVPWTAWRVWGNLKTRSQKNAFERIK